ncbi:right-handed parallel beta-helix repeat-containing protein [Catenovulum maritimum]|uniref:Right handed beta helix domain-containing protein n=1 Tax=Catenovulum maritimum TaxID=1513271 RepID=A0A0J8GU56_9ALTE|nr:right-handed parallel beta-helix repeat-containing protein [Catenovulum maritimum]KMT64844.1 hypothetical protein XM47_12435 [Catenovulum maritimum]
MIKKQTSLLSTSILGLALFSANTFAADCSSTPVNPNGNASKLQDALQQATNTGLPIRITGTYYISNDIKVYLKKDLVVDATGAKFIATTNLDGDLFSIDAHATKSNECGSSNTLADFNWKGGDFNIANAKVSTVVPYPYKTPEGKTGTQSTADALSVRGGINSHNTNKLGEAVIENITVTGTKNNTDTCFEAGGDSGILLTGGTKVTVKNNSFYGIRDAAVYLTASGDNGQYGDHFTFSNNYVERACYALTSKRGADNLKFLNNTINNVLGGIGVPNTFTGRTATNVVVRGNKISKTIRGISMYRVNNATIENNEITELGAITNGLTKAIGAYGNVYEGILLAGTQGTNTLSNNTIKGVTGSREGATETYGVTYREHDGRSTTGVSISNHSYSKLNKWVKDFQ